METTETEYCEDLARVRGDKMLRAYVECALWSSTDDDERPLDERYDVRDIAPETLASMVTDVQAFYIANDDAIDGNHEQAGHDLWLTRNGHGVGFWARPDVYGDENARKLTDAAHAMGERNLYVGDDGRIYSMEG
jgi:hypothetical protein